MKIIFTATERPLVHTIELETLYPSTEFREELDNENWQVEVIKINEKIRQGLPN